MVRSAGFRFAALFACMFAAASLALVSLIWWTTAGSQQRAIDRSILADMQMLEASWQGDGGIQDLMVRIRDMLAEDVEASVIVLLTTPERRFLAGNLDSWPRAVSPEADSWYEIEVLRVGAQVPARITARTLPDNSLLLVGRDITGVTALRDMIREAILWSILLTILLALLGGLMTRRLLVRRLKPFLVMAERFASGDLTQRVPAQETGDEINHLALKLNDMLDRIVMLMEGIQEVSNAIAHDLRTPITRARNRLEESTRSLSDTETMRADIERAIMDLDDITAVFQALMRINEIQSGARRAAFARTNLTPVLLDMAETYEAVAEEREVKVVTDLPSVMPFIGDRNLVAQAVANMLDNAVKFTPSGTTVTLSAQIKNGRISISVQDQGKGIAPEDRPRATSRFWRAEAARHTPGSGLGLALVEAVAALHNGTLELGDANPGLCATLQFPARP